MDNPNVYLTLFALLIKVWAGYRLRQNRQAPAAKLCFIFLLVVYFQSTLEFYSYYVLTLDEASYSLLLLKLYYLSLTAFLILLPNLYFNIIFMRRSAKIAFPSVILFVFMCALTLNTDLIIVAVEKLKYAFTAVKGDYYWIFRTYCLSILIVTLSGLIGVYKKTDSEIKRVKSANMVIAYIPLFLLSLTVLLLMKLGVPITAAGIVSLALSFIVFVLAENLNPDAILDLRAFIPGTQKFSMAAKAAKPFWVCTTSSEHENYHEQYDFSLLEIADRQFKFNADKARWLGVSEPTFYKKKARLKKLKSNNPRT